MIYTGLERFTNQEILNMAYDSGNMVAMEMAKRLSSKLNGRAWLRADEESEKAALRAVRPAGVNPIPLNVDEGEEDE